MWTCPKCKEQIEDQFEVCWACGTSVDGVEDPTFGQAEAEAAREPTRAPGVGPAAEFVTVATFWNPVEAQAARTHLEAEGIRTFLADELTVVMDWLLANAVGGVKLQVLAEDAERARQLLAEGRRRPADAPEADEE